MISFRLIKNRILQFYNSRFLRKFYLFIGLIWAIPISIIIRIISPIIKIRIGRLLSPFIGHYAGDTEIYLSEKWAKINMTGIRHVDLWFHSNHVIANEQLERMWRKQLIILPRFILAPIHKLNSLLPGGEKYIAKSTFHDRDIKNVLDIHPPTLSFSEKEVKEGQEILLQMGVPTGKPYVCLLIRDQAYHKNMEYTNYRNADIANFIPALEELTKRGFYVIRMGKRVTNKLNFDNNKIIDYAASRYRTDFMDIYLGAYCKFVISTSSGWDMVASTLFRRPILYTNMVPISQIMTWTSRHTFMLKRHWSIQEKRYLTLTEIFDVIDKDHRSINPKFTENGVSLIENSAEELKKAVLELVSELDGSSSIQENKSVSSKQVRFWEIFNVNIIKHNLTAYHGKMEAKISESFLDTAPEFLN